MINRLKQMIDGDAKNPDVVRFRRTSVGIWVVVFVTFLVVWLLWHDESALVFAVPEFPSMKDCTSIDLHNPTTLPPFVRIFPTPKDALNDCEFHTSLFSSYNGVKNAMLAAEHKPSWEWAVRRWLAVLDEHDDTQLLPNPQLFHYSVEMVIKYLASVVTFFGTLIFSVWSGTSKTYADRMLYKKHIQKFATGLFLSTVLAFLMYLSIDFVWFIFERVLPIPLVYGKGTSILFTVLTISVIAFFVIHWASEITVVQLSIFASMLLMFGLLAGMMVTNHVWDTGVTNAFSTMSERAYDERLAFEVAGNLGSRLIFRSTFIASGVMLIVYSIQLSSLVWALKHDTQTFHLAAPMRTVLRPRYVGIIGSLAGGLTMFVGLFPTDGTCVRVLGCDLLNIDVSGKLHLVGAFGGPLFLMFMTMTYWFIGHPHNPHSSYIKRMRRLSSIATTISGVAIMMYLSGYRIHISTTSEDRQTAVLLSIGFALALTLMLFSAKFLQKSGGCILSPQAWRTMPEKRYLLLPIGHGVLIAAVGYLLGRSYPLLITTVSLEFIVLLFFSLFIYSYSLYTVEFMDDNTPCEDVAELEVVSVS